jgi:hypothetical protein
MFAGSSVMITEVQYEGVGATRFVEFVLPAMLNLDQVSLAVYRFTSAGGVQTIAVNLDGTDPAANILGNSSPDGVWRYVLLEMPVNQPAGGRYGLALVWRCADGTTGVTDFIIYGSSNSNPQASVAINGLAAGASPRQLDRLVIVVSFRGKRTRIVITVLTSTTAHPTAQLCPTHVVSWSKLRDASLP